MQKNILVSALGAQYTIIEETIGFVNYSHEHDFYRLHPTYNTISQSREKAEFANNQVDELWLVATDKEASTNYKGDHVNSTKEDFEAIKTACSAYVSKIRLFVLKGIKDITNDSEAMAYRDLAFRVIAFASQCCKGGKLYLSLACGRKTMSADFQEAAYCFGCDTLIHILGNSKEDALPLNLGIIPKNEVITNIEYPNFGNAEEIYVEPATFFLMQINQKKKEAQHFYTTYYLKEEETRSNFHILYTLAPSKIEMLRNEKIGVDKALKEKELEYLRKLPKADLHCHLGGVLSAAEMIEVARCYQTLIEEERQKNKHFAEWECKYDGKIPIKTWYEISQKQFNIDKGLVVASLILKYEQNPKELHRLIFNKYVEEAVYQKIGMTNYEKLGDLQGSALLCNEDAIRKTVQILLRNCLKENVLYIEIRCSPVNYITDKLSAKKVLNAIFEELEKVPEVESSVLIIASRHGNSDKINQSIELMNEMKQDKLFVKYFRGFDLAGDEEAQSPQKMRDLFLNIMKDCYNITIHAGETAPSENIWEAVYHLNAERIGHGLELINNKDLMNKFLERGIGIEMCPSSNFQIVGFKDNYFIQETQGLKDYPLKQYLDRELKVTVNTDNPGISQTNLTYELHRAARLTKGGLSKWDLLQLICNSFRTAFYPYEKKKKLIRKVEETISELIKENKL